MAYYNRYTPARTSTAPASEAQLNFIAALLRDRQVDELHRLTVEGEIARGLLKSRASDVIGALKALPFVPREGAAPAATSSNEAVAEGVYELDGSFYAVRTSKNDRTRRYAYLAVISDTSVRFEYAKGAVYRLADARALTVDEVEALSLQFSKCFLCGRTLTAKDSKARGIGPVCVKKIAAVTAVG
jgi:hypothetical protein